MEYNQTVEFVSPSDVVNHRRFRLCLNKKGLDWASGSAYRNSRFACWHVHGDFFNALFHINPDAVVYSQGRRITKHEGNWVDYGRACWDSQNREVVMVKVSESCKCER